MPRRPPPPARDQWQPRPPGCARCGHDNDRHGPACNARGCQCASFEQQVPLHVREAERLGIPVADMVPGTAMDWPGLARMAYARWEAGQPVTERDRVAMGRHPELDPHAPQDTCYPDR